MTVAGWQDCRLVTIRVPYLIVVRLTGWVALLARSAASNDAELPPTCPTAASTSATGLSASCGDISVTVPSWQSPRPVRAHARCQLGTFLRDETVTAAQTEPASRPLPRSLATEAFLTSGPSWCSRPADPLEASLSSVSQPARSRQRIRQRRACPPLRGGPEGVSAL